MDRTRICVGSSIGLESAEKSLLNAVLPEDAASYSDAKPEIPVPASDSPVSTHEGWQPLATVEIGSLFVLGVATLSLLFLKSLAEEGGKRFWDAIVALHRRVAARNKALRLRGLQVRLTFARHRNGELEVIVTVPDALYRDGAQLVGLIQESLTEMPEATWESATVVQEDEHALSQPGRGRSDTLLLHGFVGASRVTWLALRKH